MARLFASSLALAALFCCLGVSLAIKAADLPGVTPDDAGRQVLNYDGQTWLVIDDANSDKPYFYNEKTATAQWSDPRSATGGILDVSEAKPPSENMSSTSIFIVAVLPVLAFAGVMIGRIYYLQTYYPDLLWPTKERKSRVRQNQKFKPQKARGKMNQDGKGGRSANS